jgi:hypothetical protein
MALGECPSLSIASLFSLNTLSFVLADTEELHGQIAQMSQRIRQLEDALSTAHNTDPHGGRHPLLREELLALKFASGSRAGSEENDDQFSLSFGTLAVTDTGGSSYFGVSAGALVSYRPCISPPCLVRSLTFSLLIGQTVCGTVVV